MDASLRVFARQFAAAVVVALLLVAVVAFLSIPYTLGGHPGEARPLDAPASGHMT